MANIIVKSNSHQYPIDIGEDIRFRLKDYLSKTYSSIMIITDETVASLYLNDVKKNLSGDRVYEVIIPVGEQTKSMEYYHKLQTEAIQNGLDRESLIIALGGGVVGDLAGFVAVTFLRGIDYIQMPTTILAHDSSVGGKVAINHELGKNLIGSFYPPRSVIYDVETLQSLSEHEVRSGYAELIKEGLIANEALFNDILQTNLAVLTNHKLKEHLCSGIKVKAAIVESDERELGERMFLNLGHTLAHALEAELGYGKLTHGEAVAIGLLFTFRVSEKTYFNPLPYDALYKWLQKNKYPLHLQHIKIENLIDKMKRDKKTVSKRIKMVLLKSINEPIVAEINDSDLFLHLHSFLGEMVK